MTDDCYVIRTDIAFEPLEKIDVDELDRACTEKWFNQSLCEVNDSVVRFGVFHGEFHWHHHELEDELFYVASERTVVLMVEAVTVTPTGDPVP